MKCLTICQPYAALIVTPQEELPTGFVQKRVENRIWNCRYRGPLLIHAGKSTKFLANEPDFPRPADMPFMQIVGVCDVTDCIEVLTTLEPDKSYRWVRTGEKEISESDKMRYPWIESHPHAEGPYCIILDNVRRFETPIPYKGAQGLFNVPDDVVSDAMKRLGKVGQHAAVQ